MTEPDDDRASGVSLHCMITRADQLLRQVHPAQFKGDQPAWVSFRPVDGHLGLLSTLHGRVGAEEAYRRHERPSGGTWAVTVEEVISTELWASEDGGEPCGGGDVNPPDHVSISMELIPTRKAVERKARTLLDYALARDCLFRPDPQ